MTQLEYKMPAYMLAFVRVEDYDTFNREYLEKAVQIVSKHGGVTFAVADNSPVIEGSLPEGRLVILEFPSKEDAEGFYDEPDYFERGF